MTTSPFSLSSVRAYPNAEETLLPDSKRFLQSTLDALSAHIAILDEQGIIIEVNAAWRRFARENDFVGDQLGVGDDYLKICDSACGSSTEGASAVAAGIRDVMAGQRAEFLLEYPCHSPEEQRWFTVRVTRFAGDGSAPVVVAHENITARKKAETAVRESEAELRAMFELASIGIAQADPCTGQWLRVNEKFCTITGYSADELLGKRIPEITHPDDRQTDWESLQRVVRGEAKDYRMDKRYVRKDGLVVWVNVNVTMIRDASGRAIRTMAAIEDITERKEAESQLRKLSLAVEQSPASVVITDPQGTIEYVNPKFCALTGYSFEDVRGKNPRFLKSGEMPSSAYRQMWATISVGAEWRGEFHNRKKNGELYWEAASISAIRDDKGTVTHFLAVKEDITARKESERQAAEALNYSQMLLETSPIGIVTFRATGELVSANASVARMIGATVDQLRGSNFRHLESWKKSGLLTAAEMALSTGRSLELEVRHLSTFGKNSWLSVQFVPFQHGGKPHLLCLHVDTTERKRADETLRESQRLQKAILSNIPDPAWLKDAQGRYLACNEPMARVYGHALEDIIGKTISEIVPERASEFLQGDDEVIRSRKPVRSEVCVIDADGCNRWFEAIESPIFDDQDEFTGMVGIARDITERKRADEVLQEQLALRERLAKIAANVPGIIYAFRLRPDGSSCLPYGSPTMADFFGVRAEDLVEDASSLLNLVLPDDQARLHDSIAESARTMTPWRCEFRFRHPTKGLFWVEGQSTPEREADGSILWHGFMSDISERKRTETALQTSMEEFRTLAESMPQMVWITRADGWNIYFSQQWMDYTGLTLEESLGHGWNKPFHPDDQRQAWDAWQQATATGGIYSLESRLRRADGVYRWWLVRGVPMRDASGNILKWFGTCTDIHDLKETETALARLAAIVESSEDAIIGKDLHGVVTSWNKGAEEIFGYTSGEMLGTSIMRLIPVEQQDEEQQILEKIKHGESVAPFETVRQAKDGRLMDVSVTASPIKDRTGQVIGLSKVARDITERKRTEESLRESEEKFRQLADRVADVFYVTSPDMQETHYVSPAYERVWGRSVASVYANPTEWYEAVLPEDRERVQAAYSQLAAEETSLSVEYRVARPDGTVRWIHSRAFQVRDAAGKVIRVTGVASDITERKHAARQLAEHQEKEERSRRALEHERELHQIKSRFVSIVSHEFRTPLCVIGMAGSLLGRYADKMTPAERSRQVQGIQTSVDRMTQMMEDLLLHGKCDTGRIDCRPSRVDVDALCRQLISEASHQDIVPRLIECVIDPAAREAFLDEKILRHILGNLLSNAVKYSSADQAVTLDVKRVAGNAPANGDTQTLPTDHLQLKVSDSGIGIPAEHLSRLFQTFHRASNIGNRPGTGMGLAIVKQFVDLHRGTIRVESTEGKGTTVWVCLPITSSDVAGGTQ